MSLKGKLEDVSVAEILQFLYLGGRTGTLQVSGLDGRRASISLHRGRIVRAVGPGSARLGNLLIAAGAVTKDELEQALRQQFAERGARTVGQILLARGSVDAVTLREVVERQYQEVVLETVPWSRGTFEFQAEQLEPIDDIGLSPDEILTPIRLDTQALIIEALRLFDERRRDAAAAPAAGPAVDASPAPAPEPRRGIVPSLSAAVPYVQLLGIRAELARDLKALLASDNIALGAVPARDAGAPRPGYAPPVVVVEVGAGPDGLAQIRSLRRARPRATLVAVVREPDQSRSALETGVVAALPPDPAVIAATLRSVIANRRDLSDEAVIQEGLRVAFSRLRRVFGDLRTGLVSTTICLNLLNIISETSERALLFLVRNQELVLLGAFGDDVAAEPLATAQGLVMPIRPDGLLARCVARAQTQTGACAEELPDVLRSRLAPDGHSAFLPVQGGRKVVAVAYVESGSGLPAPELELLALATQQVGIAFENELLRRQLDAMTHRAPEARAVRRTMQ